MIHSDELFDDSSQEKRNNVESISSSSSVFDKLTDELLIETLIRLPLKPANICKCISVRFRSLISTPYFVGSYLNYRRKINDSFALYYYSDPENLTCMAFGSPNFESPGFSLSFLPCLEHETIQYLASNNGLVLCSTPRRRRRVVYFVCNPLTKQWIALPPPPTYIKRPYIGFICNPHYLCNDDHEQRRVTSFKVVRIRAVTIKSSLDTLSLEIFCSESGRWSTEYYRPSSTSYREQFLRRDIRCPSAVVCGGLLLWNNLSKRHIFTYDPYNGKCGSIGYPPGIIDSGFQCLGESGGRLRYAKFCRHSKTYRVWELKDCSNGGDQWFLLHKVHFDEMGSTVQRIIKDAMGLLPPHPLNQDIVFFGCRFSRRILEYNLRTKLLTLPFFLQDAKINCQILPLFFPFVLPCWPTTIPLIEQHGDS